MHEFILVKGKQQIYIATFLSSEKTQEQDNYTAACLQMLNNIYRDMPEQYQILPVVDLTELRRNRMCSGSKTTP
jgi:hypothetical protein